MPSDNYALASSTDVRACAALARAGGRVALDTEFMSEGRYRAMLCLSQVAVDDPDADGGVRTILIDGIGRGIDVEPLALVLADPAIKVVFHAGRQDVAILRRTWRTELCNIFDTQIAAGFVGQSAQAGYGNLLASVLRLRVGKTASYTRWDARPLTDEQLCYAADDVAHLLALTDELERRLRQRGRLQWALEECRRLEGVSDERDPVTAWERLPRVSQLDPQARAVARRLACWRERTAAEEDRPVGQIVQDPPLVELARRHPKDLAALARIRGVHPSIIKRRGPALLEVIRAGLRDPAIPRDPRHSSFDARDAPVIALAEALLRARAIDAGIAYELIASRHDLEQIIMAARQSNPEPDVRTLTGWRRELVGADLESLLSGRSALAIAASRELELRPLG